MNSKALTFAAVVAAQLLLVVGAAGATVIISNPSVNDGTQTLIAETRIKAIGFTMGATLFDLDSASLHLCFESALSDLCGGASAVGVGGIPTVRLFSDSSGAPDSPLFTFTNPSFGTGVADYLFLPPSPFTLLAGASYWLAVHSSNGGEFDWEANDSATTPTGAFATHLGSRFAFDGAPDPPVPNSAILNIYTLNGTVTDVPEPSTFLLLAGGIALVVRKRAGRGVGNIKAPR